MKKQKITIDIHDYPEILRALLLSGNVYDSSCSSNARTMYCDSGHYIKVDNKGELAQEALLGKLFYSMGLGVEVVNYYSLDKDYLVTRSAIGEDLTHYLTYPKQLCELLAGALRELHCQSVNNAPMSSRLRRYLDSANGDFSGGYYDESVLMDSFRIKSKEEAWNIMQASKGKLKANTLIHGDACLPNVICNKGKFSSFIDFNMAGSGDKHIDLYWALWSLQYNLKTEQYMDYFLEQYGRENFDFDMIKVVAAFEVFG